MSKNMQASGMIDISKKEVTKRVARAQSVLTMTKKAFDAFMREGSPKGDVLETAKISGIMAAKNTSNLISMCHPLALDQVKMTFDIRKKEREIISTAEISCHGRTGVEMEALTAVSVASLTIYDMMKWADKGSVIRETRLLSKRGGKSGDFNA